ncbi:MAG: hypothetical protein ACYSVY_00245 [Planctomycetota bacterium]|jgi:hypothetical protein
MSDDKSVVLGRFEGRRLLGGIYAFFPEPGPVAEEVGAAKDKANGSGSPVVISPGQIDVYEAVARFFAGVPHEEDAGLFYGLACLAERLSLGDVLAEATK